LPQSIAPIASKASCLLPRGILRLLAFSRNFDRIFLAGPRPERHLGPTFLDDWIAKHHQLSGQRGDEDKR